MCLCTPSIRMPICPNCAGGGYVYSEKTLAKTFNETKEIIKVMTGLSEEGFVNRYTNDPYFHTGFDGLVRLLLK